VYFVASFTALLKGLFLPPISLGEYTLISNFFGRSQVAKPYRTAVTVTALVTLVACYHYFRIFDSWVSAFTVVNGTIKPTGIAFNDAYRYVDWLLTVPLLLLELLLVMKLPQKRVGFQVAAARVHSSSGSRPRSRRNPRTCAGW